MLPKQHRPTAGSIRYLLRRGKRWHGRWLTIYWMDHQYSTRWGVHIAKKAAKYAIQRNISKRAIFAVIDDVGGLSLDGGLFFVTVNKKYIEQLVQFFAKKNNVPLYRRIYALVYHDLNAFVSFYLSQ